MTDDTHDDKVLSRRDALKGGLLAAGAALVPNSLAKRAVAQSQSARIVLGRDNSGQNIVEIDDETQGDGTHDIVVRHVNNNDELRYDASAGNWEAQSLAVNSLVDSTDGQPWESLRNIGFDTGDRFIYDVSPFGRNSDFITSSGSFQSDTSHNGQTYVDLTEVPQDVTLEARFFGETSSTMDTTGDYRGVIDNRGGSTYSTPSVSSSSSFDQIRTGTVEITERDLMKCEHQVRSDGSNNVSLFIGAIQLELVI